MNQKCLLFVGRTAYKFPLDRSIQKKWSLLSKYFKINILASSSSSLNLYTFQKHNINFFLIPKSTIGDQLLFFVKALFFELILIFNYNIEIIICQGPLEGVISFIGKTIARLFGKKVKIVQEFHGDWETAYALYWNIRLHLIRQYINFVIRHLTIFLIKKADAIRVITNFVRKKILPYSKGKYLIQFPGYIEIDYFLKKEEKVQKRQTKRIIFAGTLHYLKGVQHLLEALPQIKILGIQEIKVIIVGDGPYRYVLQNLSQKLNIEKHVKFVGEKSQREVKKYIQHCDLLVLPSLSEGLGRVLIEAMACEKPVVASRVGGIPEIVKENYNGMLFKPGNVNELASKVYEVLTNSQLSKKLSKNGKDFAQTFFSVEKYINGYKTLVNCLDDP